MFLRLMLFLLPLLGGCGTSPPGVTTEAVGDDPLADRLIISEDGAFDFGTVLAHDQILRHEFSFRNPSPRAIRLTGSEVKVPRCSAVEPLPPLIPPGGEVRVGVTLKAGHAAESKRIGFEVQTDSPEWPVLALAVTARLLPDWEAVPISEAASELPMGESRRCSYRILCRSRGDQGLTAPEAIEVQGHLRLESVGPSTTIAEDREIVSVARDIVAIQAACSEVGARRGDLVCRWPNAPPRSVDLQWRVDPQLRLAPESLILESVAAPKTASVIIRSSGRAFRLLGVAGPLLAGDVLLPDHTSATQIVRIAVDPTRARPGVKPEIVFTTDDPAQPTLTMQILILANATGRSE